MNCEAVSVYCSLRLSTLMLGVHAINMSVRIAPKNRTKIFKTVFINLVDIILQLTYLKRVKQTGAYFFRVLEL